MPITYDLDSDACSILTRCAGTITYDEVVGHFRELVAVPGLPAKLDVLLDLREMESLPESGQMRGVATEIEQLRARVELDAFAIVTDRDALYGMVRMFQVFAEGFVSELKVFRDYEAASRWLAEIRSARR